MRIRMAQSAMAYGLNDDEWDSEALLIQMMASISAIMDSNLNPMMAYMRPQPPVRPEVQYFHIGDPELNEREDQQGAEGRN